ncbi:18523_t:CDS:2 [Funneliformis geosporum]|uniref:3265_t:CDS:1 n=1 Tax=Funneliformis geosporum TaxID=1117311 RepID=A0A9W4WMW6_9GLOM|nr:3265_t:CDS:2 [Funneliformis geosporum]CAI2167281.1 18523_t:CDS:2 [Funneliformis geosporum]
MPNSCILAIGNTGNGKSFTATIFGAKDVRIGHSTKSETDTITVHNIKDGGFYIDTPGFDDSDEHKDDEDTKRSIFFKMMESGIENITTILWFVTPDDRAKASYKRQAKFIESLAKYYNGNAWDNTIIVTKGASDSNNAGPRDAAREMATSLLKTGEFRILLFENLPPKSVYRKMHLSSDELNEYGVFKESEPERILAKYESLMEGHVERPIALKIRKVKCLKCPEETDPRLASPNCHLDSEFFHPNTESVHQGNVIDIHPASDFYKHSDSYVGATTRNVFDNSPQAWTVRAVTFGRINPDRPEFVPGYWNCCKNNDANALGCKHIYHCCERAYSSSGCEKIYDGCKHKVWETACHTICKNCKKKLDDIGCKSRCKNCKHDNPLSIKGCIDVSHKFP